MILNKTLVQNKILYQDTLVENKMFDLSPIVEKKITLVEKKTNNLFALNIDFCNFAYH